MKKLKNQIGRWGEAQAIAYLTRKGYSILAQNYRTAFGEIDIVAWKNWMTIFVEVKTRTSKNFGLPETAITPQKQEHMLKSALNYLQDHPEYEGDWQIDVIAIRNLKNQETEIVHFENALTG